MAERRGTVRAVARIEVQDQSVAKERVPLFVSGNVSSGGIFLITNDPYEAGTELLIRFNLPDDPVTIEATGSVVWRRTDRESSDRPPGMGVQFQNISQDDRERIRSFVNVQVELGNIDPET